MMLFRELKLEVLTTFSEIGVESGAEMSVDKVRDLVSHVRESLSKDGVQTGMWEASELNYADVALDAGFPKLALIAAGKALALGQLSPEEYAFGFSASRQNDMRRTDAALSVTSIAKSLLDEQAVAARVLRASEAAAAVVLEKAHKSEAVDLKAAQGKAAIALQEKQAIKALQKKIPAADAAEAAK